MAMQIKANVRQISDSTSEATARGHSSLVDRPETKGGSNRGPMGGELMLMGIGGCFMSNLLAAVKARGLAIDDLAVEITATLENDPPHFSEIALAVSSAHPDRTALAEMITLAERSCLAVNTVRMGAKLSANLA